MKRLDLAMVEAGIAPSRARAQSMIAEGKVAVRGRVCRKPAELVAEASEITILEPDHPWVSRGGIKLDAALRGFSIEPRGFRVLDVGVSTGGFSHCLLERGAAEVVGVDVGHDQLAHSLRGKSNLRVLEGVHIRDLQESQVGGAVDLVVVDVSFISLTKVIPYLPKFLQSGGQLVALVKPQFEVGRAALDARGVVRRAELYPEVLSSVKQILEQNGFTVAGEMVSPVEGGDGNREFLLHAIFSGRALV